MIIPEPYNWDLSYEEKAVPLSLNLQTPNNLGSKRIIRSAEPVLVRVDPADEFLEFRIEASSSHVNGFEGCQSLLKNVFHNMAVDAIADLSANEVTDRSPRQTPLDLSSLEST